MKPLLIKTALYNVSQTVADHQTGPDWIGLMVIVILGIISVVLLSGRGSFLIAGYNTASKSEKEKYDVLRLCHVMGLGLGCITVSFVLLMVFKNQLSDWWIGFQVQFVIVVVIIMIVLANTWCKRK